jgi:hypothetical protein
VQPAAAQFVPCRPGATVLYINGVNQDDVQTVAFSAQMLQQNIADSAVTCVALVHYLHNPSEGLFADVLGEMAIQIASESAISISDAILQVGYVVAGRVTTLGLTQQAAIKRRVATFIQSVSLSTYQFTVDGVIYTTAEWIARFRDRILTELGQGTKVVLVAHSQGNFFANETYRAVRDAAPDAVSQGLAVVNVANTTASPANGLGITTHQDLWIAALDLLVDVMDSNFDAAGSYTINLMGHNFVEIYMNRFLPIGTTEANSVAGRVMTLLQTALDLAQPPVGVFYGSTSHSLFDLDPATGTATILGPFTYASSALVPVWDIAVNPRGGLVYAISPNAISTFDPSMRVLARLPQSTVGGNALAFNADGELYAMGGSSLYRVDTATGTATASPISLGTYVSSGDLTFDSDGILFGTVIGPNNQDYLIRIDLNRSTFAVVGPTGYSELFGLYFSGGYLFGVTNNGTLITIDRATGQGQTVGSLTIGDVTGLQ